MTASSNTIVSEETFVEKEFIEENVESIKNKSSKKGGPYNKKERLRRRDNVFLLHFEYGYPAVKIANIMNVNRNTINNDINYLYSKLSKEWKNHDIFSWWLKQMRRLEIQRTRLREALDMEADFKKRLAIEKMIFDIDLKLLQLSIKAISTNEMILEEVITGLNDYAKKNNLDLAFWRNGDIGKLPKKDHEKVRRMIENAQSNRMGRER